MKKNIFLVLIFILSLSSVSIARVEITEDEENTVKILKNLGVIEKERSEFDLNQPLSAIDSMSMEIKGLIVSKEDMINRDKEIIDRLNNKITNSEDKINEIESNFMKKDLEFKELKRQVEFNDNLHYLIELGLFLFILGK